MSFHIRLASTREAGLIAMMSRDLIETGLGWSWTPPRVRRCIADRSTNVIVAIDDGTVAGFALMQYAEEDAHLLLLAVKPWQRRRGIGRELVSWLEKTAVVAGIGTIHLEVRARNQGARAFYRRLGFLEGETVIGYYRGLEAALCMRRELRPACAADRS